MYFTTAFCEAVVKISEHGYLKTIWRREIMNRVWKKMLRWQWRNECADDKVCFYFLE
jgi:hypothetical protein